MMFVRISVMVIYVMFHNDDGNKRGDDGARDDDDLDGLQPVLCVRGVTALYT